MSSGAKQAASSAVYKGSAQVLANEGQVAYRVGTAATGSIGKGFAAGAASTTIGLAGAAGGMAGDYVGTKLADGVGAKGIDKQAIETSAGFAGAMGSGAAVGACVAGPAGAAAGAALGAGGQAVANVVGTVVDLYFQDDRYDFGFGAGTTCSICSKFCQNRGCKACNKNYCEECYPQHRKKKHGK